MTNETLTNDLRYWELRAGESRMNARFAGRCRWCGGDVPAGTAIAYNRGTKTLRHTILAECNGSRAPRQSRPTTTRIAPARVSITNTGRICTNCGGRVPAHADHGLCDNCG